jgi:hypothetical protein
MRERERQFMPAGKLLREQEKAVAAAAAAKQQQQLAAAQQQQREREEREQQQRRAAARERTPPSPPPKRPPPSNSPSDDDDRRAPSPADSYNGDGGGGDDSRDGGASASPDISLPPSSMQPVAAVPTPPLMGSQPVTVTGIIIGCLKPGTGTIVFLFRLASYARPRRLIVFVLIHAVFRILIDFTQIRIRNYLVIYNFYA